MSQVAKIRQNYEELINKPITKRSYNEDGEWISTLYQTQSIRILVVIGKDTPKQGTIEIEISLPKTPIEDNDDEEFELDQGSGTDSKKVLIAWRQYLQYLLQLRSSGFSINNLGSECTWTASRTFKEVPQHEIFESLFPP